MAKRLKQMRIDAVGLVDKGANQNAMIVIAKRGAEGTAEEEAQDQAEAASSEGPCPTCGGDHPEEGHAAAMRSKKEKTMEPATKSVDTAVNKKEELVVDTKDAKVAKADEKIEAPVATNLSGYEKAQKELRDVNSLLEKQLADAQDELDKRKAEVTKIYKERRREKFIKRAAELEHLPGAPADDFAEFLDDVEKALGDKRFAKFNGLLESWNTVIEKSKLFEEVGVNGGEFGFTGPEGQLDIMAKELQARDAKLTYAKAYEKALRTPEGQKIYQRHLKESRTRKEQ
jgi:DNA repair exonuclease SbcCD ATPase subunit